MTNDKITDVEDAFWSFERTTARVPDDENAAAKEIHPQLRAAVVADLAVLAHFLSGSYGRRTQAMKLHDVDVVVVLDDPDGHFRASASGTLEAVREIVSDHELVRRTHVSVRAVKAFLHDHEFHVDIVPALAPLVGSGLDLACNMPDVGRDEWTLEDPKGQLAAATAKNKETSGLYVPATRIVKAWNQRYETVRPLKSYHAEAILWHSIGGAATLQEAVIAFFDGAYEMLAPGIRTLVPGSATRFVDDRLEDEERRAGRERVAFARELAHEAADEDDPQQAMEKWVGVFGAAFPAPSTDPDAIAQALPRGAAKGTGAGIVVGPRGERRPIPARSWRRS